MAYYDALIAAWNGGTQPPSGVTGSALTSGMTTAQKLAAVNGWTVPGPNIDVRPAQVVGYLALNAKLAALLKYAGTPPATEAGVAAAELAAMLQMGPNAPTFSMSNPIAAEAISGMLNAIASDSTSGLTANDVSSLLALALTTIPWWQSVNYSSSIAPSDLEAAGGLT